MVMGQQLQPVTSRGRFENLSLIARLPQFPLQQSMSQPNCSIVLLHVPFSCPYLPFLGQSLNHERTSVLQNWLLQWQHVEPSLKQKMVSLLVLWAIKTARVFTASKTKRWNCCISCDSALTHKSHSFVQAKLIVNTMDSHAQRNT